MTDENTIEWTDPEVHQEVGRIVSNFPLLECYQAAIAVTIWLNANGLDGTIWQLKTKYGEDFVISDRLERRGITESITRNGTHYGVEVRGLVFDNLSSEGMPKEEWIRDFHCLSEEFEIEEVKEI